MTPEDCEAMVAQLQIEAELEYEGGEVEPPKFYAQAEDPRIEEQQEEIEELRAELEELKKKKEQEDYVERDRFSEIQEKLRQIPEIKRGS
jgi:transposase